MVRTCCCFHEVFSESELPLSYNAHIADARTQLIGYETNLLNKVWRYVDLYIYKDFDNK